MISEIVNALMITYFATEFGSTSTSDNNYTNNSYQGSGYYLRRSTTGSNGSKDWTIRDFWTSNRKHKLIFVIVVIINVFDQITGAAAAINWALQGFLHIPKVIFAAVTYFLAIYIDVRSNVVIDFRREYLPLVGKAILYILPVYPILAVFISFGFLFIITAFEKLGIPVEILNWPIYYGTLYGPFSYIYYSIKQQVLRDKTSLPTTATPSSNYSMNRWNDE
jgi:hypothetical protein